MTIIGSHLAKRNRNISEKNDETIPHFKHKSTRFPNFRGVSLYFHGILCYSRQSFTQKRWTFSKKRPTKF